MKWLWGATKKCSRAAAGQPGHGTIVDSPTKVFRRFVSYKEHVMPKFSKFSGGFWLASDPNRCLFERLASDKRPTRHEFCIEARGHKLITEIAFRLQDIPIKQFKYFLLTFRKTLRNISFLGHLRRHHAGYVENTATMHNTEVATHLKLKCR